MADRVGRKHCKQIALVLYYGASLRYECWMALLCSCLGVGTKIISQYILYRKCCSYLSISIFRLGQIMAFYLPSLIPYPAKLENISPLYSPLKLLLMSVIYNASLFTGGRLWGFCVKLWFFWQVKCEFKGVLNVPLSLKISILSSSILGIFGIFRADS